MYQNFIILYFIWSSTCFGRHTAHHQEPKTAQEASSFAYVEGCQTCCCWTLSGSTTLPDNVQQQHIRQPEAACAVLGSWWWAVYRPKHVEWKNNKILINYCILNERIIKFWYTIASFWVFLCENWPVFILPHHTVTDSLTAISIKGWNFKWFWKTWEKHILIPFCKTMHQKSG